jgi:hypothetical protein
MTLLAKTSGDSNLSRQPFAMRATASIPGIPVTGIQPLQQNRPIPWTETAFCFDADRDAGMAAFLTAGGICWWNIRIAYAVRERAHASSACERPLALRPVNWSS